MAGLKEILDIIVERNPFLRPIAAGDIGAAWSAAVGEVISAVTRPERLSGDNLFVTVRDAAWIAQLTMMKPDIIRSLAELPEPLEIKDIRFKAGAVRPPAVRRETMLRGEVPKDVGDRIDELVGTIEDREIQLSLKRILRAAYLHVKNAEKEVGAS